MTDRLRRLGTRIELMDNRKRIWLAVIDGRDGRLLRGQPSHCGSSVRLRLKEVESICNPWVELDSDVPEVPAHQGAGDRRSELLVRYAVDLVHWLAGQV